MVNPRRGVLYPARLPQFHRIMPTGPVADLVAWFWIPEWDIEPGRSSRQDIVGYPALNLVVEPGKVALSGPTTRAWHRDLRGRGWAVGALLRPAAVPALAEDPAALVDGERMLQEAGLLAEVSEAMESGTGHRERAVEAFSSWILERVGPVDEPGRLANAMTEVLLGEDAALTPEEAATRLAVSVRTLQRLAHRHVGVSPGAMIRRRRLQEAAERLRDDPGSDLATVAAELGYADHAHLTRDFRSVLGIPPRKYRGEVRSSPEAAPPT